MKVENNNLASNHLLNSYNRVQMKGNEVNLNTEVNEKSGDLGVTNIDTVTLSDEAIAAQSSQIPLANGSGNEPP